MRPDLAVYNSVMNCVVMFVCFHTVYWAALSNIQSGRVKRFKRQPHKLEILGFDSLGPHPIKQ